MASFIANMPALVIVSGSSYSNAVAILDDAVALTLFSPTTLTGTGITIEVEPTTTGTSFVTLQSGGSDIIIPASKATVLNMVGWRQIRLASNATEGGARSFSLTKTYPV